MMTVYLAGPITGLDFKGATDWRASATEYLAEHGIRGVSPMRAKDFLSRKRKLAAMGYDDHPLATPHGIITRDRWDCTHSNLVLFNFLGAESVSIGTVMEVAWADGARVPAVLVMEPKNIHEHGMVVAACGWRVHTLEDGLELVVSILKESGVDR